MTGCLQCKDSNRQEDHPHEQFDFLGFTFRPLKATTRRGGLFSSFSPAISKQAKEKVGDEIQPRLVDCSGTEFAETFLQEEWHAD